MAGSGPDAGGADSITGDAARASGRRPAVAERDDPRAAPAPAVGLSDLQTLLSTSVARLAATVGCVRACAWWGRPDGRRGVAAAAYAVGAPLAPGPDDVEALRCNPLPERAFDTGSGSVPDALSGLAERHGFQAGRVVRSGVGEAVAVLWVGGVEGGLRPRHLAHLDEVGERLADPASTWIASRRLHALDSEVRRLDRLSSLGDLLSEIVHEIRNPLVSMKTFLQLLPGREDDPEFTGEFREMVLDEMARLERLLDSVVEHARPATSPDDGDDADVAAGCASIAGLLRHRALDREVELEIRVTESLPRIPITPDGLRQLLLNLTLNAIEVTPAGGTVVLEARMTGAGVELAVTDAGPGVPDALRERVFEPFFSTRRERAGGLGLAISRRLVEETGGSLRVVAAPDGGARFVAVFPHS